MVKPFKTLEIGMIEEGRLVRDVNQEFADVQRKLCEFVSKWGDRAAGAKGELMLKITIKADDTQDGVYSVKSDLRARVPSRPPRVTTAISSVNDEGQTVLFGRASGTTNEDPRQGRMFTEDGATIDPETGRPVTVDADGVIQ